MASKYSHSNSSHPLPKGGDERYEDSDWEALGNVLESYLIEEADKLSLAKSRRKGATSKDTHEWLYAYTEDDVKVFRKRSSDCCFVGQGVINRPLHQVAELVKDIESSYIWEKFLVEARCARVFSASESCIDYIGYERFQAKGCLYTFKRDMVYFCRCAYRGGRYVQSQVSVEDKMYPLRPSVPRIEVKMGTGFILEPLNGDDSVTNAAFFFNMDLKGLPGIIMSQVLKKYPLVIGDIRRHLEEMEEQERQQECRKEASKPTTMPSVKRRASQGRRSELERRGDDLEGERTMSISSRILSQYHDPIPLDHYMNATSKATNSKQND